MFKLKTKKIPKYLAILILLLGSCIYLGLLSFIGSMALWPIVALGYLALGMAVGFEGEIYLQNITQTLNKLFKTFYTERLLAKTYLLDQLNLEATDKTPRFFDDYNRQIYLLNQFNDKRLTDKSLAEKKAIETTLTDMEKWFALQLFTPASIKDTEYVKELKAWFKTHGQDEVHRQCRYQKRGKVVAILLSIMSGGFMTLGFCHLLTIIFTKISWLAVIPVGILPQIIIPLAIVVGLAYTTLTMNSLSDMINGLPTGWKSIKKTFKERMDRKTMAKNIGMAIVTILLLGLAIALTAFTVGSWKTIVTDAQNTGKLYTRLKNLPSFIMTRLYPSFAVFSTIIFNLQNTSSSMKFIYNKIHNRGAHAHHHVKSTESGFQRWNPFRLIIKFFLIPFRLILFIGHLFSIGLQGDQIKHVPKPISVGVGAIAEGAEDTHYFEDYFSTHSHHLGGLPIDDQIKTHYKNRLEEGHGHSHNNDIPTLILQFILLPIYLLATLWHWAGSQFTSTPCGFKRSAEIIRGILHEKETVEVDRTEAPSNSWVAEHGLYRCERFEKKHVDTAVIGGTLIDSKEAIFAEKKAHFRAESNRFFTASKSTVKEPIKVTLTSGEIDVLNTQRNPLSMSKTTASVEFYQQVLGTRVPGIEVEINSTPAAPAA